jgi:ADP-heptose:LPS heptosyltransferase
LINPSGRIVVFKPGPIGDFIHSLPVIYHLKDKYPGSHLTAVTNSNLCELVEGNPFIDEAIYVPPDIFRNDLPGFLRFISEMRDLKPDLFVDLKSNVRSFIIRMLSGAGTRVHYRKQRVTGRDKHRLHAIENLLETIYPVTGKVTPGNFTVYTRTEDDSFAESFIEGLSDVEGNKVEDLRLVAFNSTVSIPNSSRLWPPEYFAKLGDRVSNELGGTILLIGGPEDRDYCKTIRSMMKTNPVVTAGKFSLGQTAALLKRCTVIVSGDTGPMHLATSVGTKVIALFGAMDPRRAGPYGEGHMVIIKRDLPCIMCEEKICPLGTTQCMKEIFVDEVFDKLKIIIAT